MLKDEINMCPEDDRWWDDWYDSTERTFEVKKHGEKLLYDKSIEFITVKCGFE